MDLRDFVGTWRSERGAPYSTITFTWTAADDGLRGEWILEATAPPPGAGEWMSNPGPRRHKTQVGPSIVEGDRVLFTVNGAPHFAEFRLLGNGEAAMGAAMDKLPPELSGPEHYRAIEGHRVHLTRVPDTTATPA